MGKKKDRINDNSGTGIPVEILMNPEKLDAYLRERGVSSAPSNNDQKKPITTDFRRKDRFNTNTGAAIAGIMAEKAERDKEATPQEPYALKEYREKKTRPYEKPQVLKPSPVQLNGLIMVTPVAGPYGKMLDIAGRAYPIIPAIGTATYEIGARELELAVILYMMLRVELPADAIYPKTETYLEQLEGILENLNEEKVVMLHDEDSLQIHLIDWDYIAEEFLPTFMRILSEERGDYVATVMNIMNAYNHWPAMIPINCIRTDVLEAQMRKFEYDASNVEGSDDDSEDIKALEPQMYQEILRERIDAWIEADRNDEFDDDSDESTSALMPMNGGDAAAGGASNDDEPFPNNGPGDMADDNIASEQETAEAPSNDAYSGGTDNGSVGEDTPAGGAAEGKSTNVSRSTARNGKTDRKKEPQKVVKEAAVEGQRPGVDSAGKEAQKEEKEKEVKPAPKAPAKKAATPAVEPDDEDDMKIPVITVGKKK